MWVLWCSFDLSICCCGKNFGHMCYLYRFVSGMRKLIIIFFPLCTCLFIEKPSCNNSLKNCRFMFLTMCIEDLNIRFGSI